MTMSDFKIRNLYSAFIKYLIATYVKLLIQLQHLSSTMHPSAEKIVDG